MLRVEFHNAADTLTIRVEGRFVGAFAEEARTLVARCKIPRELVVDLSEVTYVDTVGEQVLAWLGRVGAEFVADSSYPRDVCERLDLPLVGQRTGSKFAGVSQGPPRSQ
jgi:hypothetical protein